MSFQDDLMKAEAIREVRASGCTMPGVAELIVEHHGALHILANTSRIQALGEEVAASDTEAGAKMREILQGEAKKVEVALEETKQITDEQTSKPVESQAAADASAGATAGSASDAAAQDEEATASAAAGTSAASSESAAHESTASLKGKGRRKDL